MLTSAQIGNIGERWAVAWLKNRGYECYRNTQLPGATDIEANSSNASLLVQVKTAVYPDLPASLGADERKAIVSRANRNNKQAWLAQLQINDEGALVGDVRWSKLN